MQNEKEVQFGFCIFPKNPSLFNHVWQMVKDHLKPSGFSEIKGPIQANTFFPYPMILESSHNIALFKSEYPSTAEQTNMLMELNPIESNYFNTGIRRNFEEVMAVSKPFYKRWKQDGLKVKTIEDIDEQLLAELLPVVNKAFAKNWSFTPSQLEAFLGYFKHEMAWSEGLKLQVAYVNGQVVGFCRFIENDAHTIIGKTIAILPEYQKQGMGNAMAFALHQAFLDHGYSTAYYAQIVEGNRIHKMPRDTAKFFRRYVTFKYALD
jgi:GNAT superfamily N-acetyltransferase